MVNWNLKPINWDDAKWERFQQLIKESSEGFNAKGVNPINERKIDELVELQNEFQNDQGAKVGRWEINDNDFRNQVENYQTLKITESCRGISVLIISALLGFSLLLSLFGVFADPTTMIWAIVLYLPILFFVYKGHRWAIVLLIIMWTFEKVYQLYEIVKNGSGSIIIPIIWWLAVAPYFWKALIVENKKRKFVLASQDINKSNFCYKCGKQLATDAKFCSKCGEKIPLTDISE